MDKTIKPITHLEVRKVNNCKSNKMGVCASICFGAMVFSQLAFSASIIVDFETNPTPTNVSSTFGRAGPAQTIEINGDLTFNGGVVLGLPTFLPTTPFVTSPNFYATANHPSGRVVGHPSLSSTLAIDIASAFGATTVEGVLLNGLNRAGSYTIEAFSNGRLVDSVSLNDLTANLSNGFDVFRLKSNGEPITSVLFFPDLLDGEWDYFIDTVAVNQPIESVIPIPASVWLFASAVLSLFGFRKPRDHNMNRKESGVAVSGSAISSI